MPEDDRIRLQNLNLCYVAPYANHPGAQRTLVRVRQTSFGENELVM